jgi:hypothetical protein
MLVLRKPSRRFHILGLLSAQTFGTVVSIGMKRHQH